MMHFESTTVHGYGRGKGLGFPTINMVVPLHGFSDMRHGVYAARANVDGVEYGGALYYGPAPTFDQNEIALEIYLLDAPHFSIEKGAPVAVDIVQFIRPVMKFDTPELLVQQMQRDEQAIRQVLKI
ncbi:MAG: riboflavin kinase [bacterium]